MAQHPVRTIFIFKRYILERNVSFYIVQFNRIFLVLNIRFNVKDLRKSLESRIAVLELFREINKDPDRLRESVDVEQERNKIRYLDKTVSDQYCTRDYNHDIYEKYECRHTGVEEAQIQIAVLLGS